MDDAVLFERSLLKDIDDAFADFQTDFQLFLTERLPNRYVYGTDVISVYARKGTHVINGGMFKCLDIAAIVIAEEYRGRGVGIRVIDHIHRVNPFRCTFVESILNKQLYDRLKTDKWIDVQHSTPPSVFKLTPLAKDNLCT